MQELDDGKVLLRLAHLYEVLFFFPLRGTLIISQEYLIVLEDFTPYMIAN